MIVTLKQKEIELAVKRFLAAKLGVAADMNFEITFAATRGDNGLTATVDLEEADDAVLAAPMAKPAKPVVQTNQGAVVDAQAQAHKPALAVVAPAVQPAAAEVVTTSANALFSSAAAEAVETAPVEVAADTEGTVVVEEAAAPVKTTSLFG